MKPVVWWGLLVGALVLMTALLAPRAAPRMSVASGLAVNPTSKPPAAQPQAPERAAPLPQTRSNIEPVRTTSQPAPTSAFTTFESWARQFLAGAPATSEARGVALAWKRREAMLELIQTDPAQALAKAVPFHWRTSLPASVTRFFEQQVDGRGALSVAVADSLSGQPVVRREVRIGDQHYRAFVYGRRLAQPCRSQIPLHGIALDGNLAVAAEPVRLLDPEETAAVAQAHGTPIARSCGVCGRAVELTQKGVAADVGGELAYFCGVDHARIINLHWTTLENTANGLQPNGHSAGQDSWTHGPKAVLYMRVNFPDDLTEPISEANAYADMNQVNTFYVEGSYDTTCLTATVTPLLTVPQVKAWYGTNDYGEGALLEDAREVSRLAGYDTANYDLDIVAFTSVPTYSFGGLAYVGGKGVWLQSMGAGVTAHELGHNYGLLHANLWDTSTNNNSSGIGPGVNVEYGNIYDTMGAAAAGNNQFNAMFKNSLDWLPDTPVAAVTSNGVYRLYAFDVPERVNGQYYAAHVRRDFQREYWLEFRQKFTSNPWLQSGVLLNWSPWSESKGGSDLLDTTPGSARGLEDAALVVGRTFSDYAAGVHITPLARGATGTNVWLDVEVTVGFFPGNQPPEFRLEVEQTNAAPGTLIHFHAAADELDGDSLAYSWTFDDGSFSTNNLAWTSKSWSSPGEHVVRCVVSDRKGGIASANALVTVGQPSGFRITGQVLDPDGLPVEGVMINDSSTNTAPVISGCTDSQGRYLITGVSGDINLYAFKYGYSFTNLTWANPITVSSNTSSADFLALPWPAVTIVADTNVVPENSAATHFFTLSRTGDTMTNLTVQLFLSGSATLGADYRLGASLQAGTNTIDFPPGTNSISISFQAINDSLIEGPETATLTVQDDPALVYVVGAPGEATITILDDDAPSQPAVSVTATSPSVPENGADSGEFVFSRTGPTQNELMIYYSVSGTAIPGTDYTTLLGAVLIPAGQSTAKVQFQPIDDKTVEPDETVIVNITPDGAYTLGGATAQVVIIDDDITTVTIFPTRDGVAEPSATGRFTVKRDGGLTPNLVIYYAVGGTATGGLDYTPLSGSVIIPSGATSADIILTPLNDSLLEGDESVVLTLSTNAAYNVGTPGAATLFIHDRQEPSVNIVATDPTASEPGDDFGTFIISRGTVVSGPLTVYLAISGTAINGIDYVPLDNTVVIPNGANSVTLNVIPFDDLALEPTEDVIITLLPSTNYNLGSPMEARVQIMDDDATSVPAAGFTFSSSSGLESQSPAISLSLSYTSAVPVTVNYRVIGGTASPNDYSLAPGPLTFDAGQLTTALPLRIIDNSIAEPDRTIRIALYDPVNATLDGIKIHTYTIVDDDTASVSVTATSPTTTEGGPTPGKFRIARTGKTTAPLVVNFEVTGTASAPADYAPLGTSATIPAGAAFIDLPVIAADDHTVELSETVTLTLISAPGGKIVSPNVATVTITDKDLDVLPVVGVTSTNHPAAVEGGVDGEFLFYRSATNGALTVFFSFSGPARSGTDYQPLPNNLTFTDGQASVVLPVHAIDDTLVEGERPLVLAITTLDSYRPAYPASAVVTIQDNEQRVRLDASDFFAAEPGTDTGGFTFTRFGTTNTDVHVFFTISGTAINGVEYVAISDSFVIPAGSLSATLPIVPLDDPLVEGPETVTLALLPDPGYYLDTPSTGTVTIQDDEPMLTIIASVPEVIEGSQLPGVFTITRSGNPNYDFTAYLAISGTADYGIDYPPILTNLYFSCGVTAIDLLIWPTNELVIEPSETVLAALVPDPAYTILAPSNAIITILDAGTNLAPQVTITSPRADMIFLTGTNANLILEATVSDDTTNPPVVWWSKIKGPDTLVFGDTNQASTTVSFTNQGLYVLRLTADDGALQAFDDVTVVLGPVDLLATNRLHWNLDEGAGTNILDASGAGRQGVWDGSPDWTTNGVLAGAVRLAGTNDCLRGLGTSNWLNGLRAFSLSLWVNSAVTNVDQGIFTADDSGTNATLALFTRTYASCSQYTNVLEAVIPTSRGVVHHVSTNNVSTYGWQHLALCWSNGLAPALFINGQLDQLLAKMVAARGYLTNCPQFIVGKGPLGTGQSWNGWIDDVRLYDRALDSAEVAALAALPPTNYGPVVKACSNLTLQVTSPAVLSGVVTDDGRPDPPATVMPTWVVTNVPPNVILTNANSLTNIVQFTQPGQYGFRLIADDGQIKTFDDVQVTVTEPTRVDVYATDPEAAELGPNTGQFTFIRTGDNTNDLTVYLAFSGIATNGLDFVELTNVVTFASGTDTVTWVVTPYLDHRTEGDQDLTITILTNLAYSIGNGQATVIIHDSPYGQWTIAHFTLEELTDPTLSGEAADFDHDGLVNFAEYAANLDPKASQTNSPVVAALVLDPTDSQQYFTLTFHRRLQPTDVAYAVYVSNDLVTWQTGTNYVQELQAVDDGNGLTETATARVVAPFSPATNQFVTVRVWLLTTGP
jgi:hypothetical protein